ncbi:MAG: hypothetical protein LW860_16855 [Xanthomonadaceae bacterium]|jgi:hypothetical protein|nr:hypothetical protein [Xanthomonadaceae bacterium]
MIRRLFAIALALAATMPVHADALTAEAIVQRAHEAAGGSVWKRPKTLHLTGQATIYRDGLAANAMRLDHYEMWRVFPAWNDAAHGANGKFRLEARAGERVVIRQSFDGTDTWDANGKVPQAQASREAGENYGFGIIRFALDKGFRLARLPDDQVEGHPSRAVRVTDPTGGETTFWIDRDSFAIRKVGFDTPRGWHERIYSDFYRVEPSGFMQPGRVRLYYRGALSNDITWTDAVVDAPIADEVFVLEGAANSE